MLNEYAYCPRLFHLMHVEGRWADNVYTEEGREVHRRVDRLDHVLPDPEADGAPKKRRQHDDGDEPPDHQPFREPGLGALG
jgi:CRISPR/Cas system-associated exonuclease Cas4 (RecB family)